MTRSGLGNKLLAMANQSASPHEAEIARRKLRAALRRDEADESWRVAWSDYKEHERIAERLAAAKREDEIAQLVKRWERGTFDGMKFESGAARTGRRT